MQNWYALCTKSRHEKHINEELDKRNIELFLPVRKIKRRWSDRVKTIEKSLLKSSVAVEIDAYLVDKM